VEGNLEEELISRSKVIKALLPRLWKDATLSSLRSKQLAKERYDKNVVHKQFQVGQLVKYLDPNPSTKFDDTFVGPCRVFRKLRNNTYLSASIISARPLKGVVNVDRLDSWHPSQVTTLNPVTQIAVDQYNEWQKTLLK
jgi:hypothetical protein